MCELVIANVTLEWFDALVNDSDVIVEAGFLRRADGTAVHRAHEASFFRSHYRAAKGTTSMLADEKGKREDSFVMPEQKERESR